MARIIEEKLFVIQCAVGRVPQSPFVLEASTMDEADRFCLAHFGSDPENEGKEIVIIAATELDVINNGVTS